MLKGADHRIVTIDDGAAWHDALDRCPHAFAHTLAYARAIAASLKQPPVLYHGQYDGGSVICPLSFRGAGASDWYTPYGFSGFASASPIEAFAENWHAFASESGAVSHYTTQHPLLPSPLTTCHTAESAPSRSLFVVDLRRPPSAIRASFGQAIRRKLNRWDRQTPAIEDNSALLTDAFCALYAATMRRADASSVYGFSADTLRAWVGDAQTVAIGTRIGGRIAAVTLFGYTPHCADYLFTVSTKAGRDHTTGLLWLAMQALRQRGVPWVNLGGGIREHDGLARYKSGFGGDVRLLHALRMICNKERYAALCRDAGVSAEQADTGYFPPYYDARPAAA